MYNNKQLKNAAFLDRDGVLITDVGHLTERDQIQILPGVSQAIKKLNDHQVPVVVITNQSAVGRGLCDEARIDDIHQALSEIFAAEQAHISRFYFCPHHPSAAVGQYKINCPCRKPKPGMLQQAARELGIKLSGSVMVGDNHTDLQAGRSVGCHTVLIADGPDSQTALQAAGTEKQPGHIATGLGGAVDWMLEKLKNSPDGVQLLPLGNVAKEVLNG